MQAVRWFAQYECAPMMLDAGATFRVSMENEAMRLTPASFIVRIRVAVSSSPSDDGTVWCFAGGGE